jgi:hypothetical protein
VKDAHVARCLHTLGVMWLWLSGAAYKWLKSDHNYYESLQNKDPAECNLSTSMDDIDKVCYCE